MEEGVARWHANSDATGRGQLDVRTADSRRRTSRAGDVSGNGPRVYERPHLCQ